jgi:DNA repair exonuclease SbcCD ATPase subunit
VKLKKLRLKNFKGLRDFSLEPNGENISVSGQNETGKTTLADGFLWLLTGKDSLGQADFDIKTRDPATEEPIHGLDHAVEGVFDLDGRETTLRKVYAEKWVKKRGAAEKEFSGHTTDYFIDDVPRSKKEFHAAVAAIAEEPLFRLLTNPRHFMSLHWQERRRMLLDVCGDVSDVDVIASDPALAPLPEILNGRTLDDHRKVLAARRAKINQELQDIPVRISEVENGMADVAGLDPKTLSGRKAHLKSDKNKFLEELQRIKSGGEIAHLTKELAEVEAKLIRVESKGRLAVEDVLSGKRKEKQELLNKNEALQRKAKSNDRLIENHKTAIAEKQQIMERLRAEWIEIDGRKFVYEPTCTCPTCGQSLPEEQVVAARERALADFNEQKSKHLAKISANGKAFKAEIERLTAEITKLEGESKALFEQAEPIAQKLRTLEIEISSALLNPPPVEPDKEEIALTARKAEIEQALSELEIGNHDAVSEVEAAIAELDNEIREREAEYARITTAESTRARIDQLKWQEKDLSAEYERLEYEQNLTDRFVTAKVSMLEEKINSRFKLARFQLFEQQINGGIAECCEVTVNGVPYSSMNNAARINAGLDIIQTLSEHYGITAPIFVDNAESVNDLYRTTSQQIRLYVSDDETLTIKESTNDRQAA